MVERRSVESPLRAEDEVSDIPQKVIDSVLHNDACPLRFDSTTIPSPLVATTSITHALSTIRMNARSTNIAHLPSHPIVPFDSAMPAPSLHPSTLATTVVVATRKGKTALLNSSSSTFLAALLRQPVTSTLIVSFSESSKF